MMGSASRTLLASHRHSFWVPIKRNSLLNKASAARWGVLLSDKPLLRRESSSTATATNTSSKKCCSSSSSASSVSPISQLPHQVQLSSKDEKSKSCCHSEATTTSHQVSSVSSSLPISSYLFWSDPSTWKTASTNTFRCLVGCTLGDMSMLFYLQSVHPTLSPGVAMGLAMGSGILTSISLETVLLRFSKASKMTWKAAFKTATGMSLISMLTMEAVENAVDYHLMGWGNVNFADPVFWRAIGLSALAGWSAPLPFNYWNLKRHGKSCH